MYRYWIFHASEYLSKASRAAFKRKSDGKEWLTEACHRLKHEEEGAKKVLKEMRGFLKKKITEEKKKEITRCITYFTNHIQQMKYPEYSAKKIPIGSGVIEAACKVIIKQRMCNSGMRWSDSGAKNILILRCFNETDGKWKQFWDKINKLGI
jgi:YesN/AraC family two-component response regulator